MNRLLLSAALSVATAASPVVAQTVVIVRHGEKTGPSGDVDLSPTGQARAAALAESLSGSRLALVLATPLKRTQQTATPTAQAAGLPVVAVAFDGGDDAHARRVADQARTAPADATVLVVGHSNTVAAIASALGDPAPRAPSDCDYDQMTVLSLNGTAPPRVAHVRYGAPTMAC